MFYKMHPDDIRLVMVDQDPYPEQCPATSAAYACGVAFAIPNECQIIPPTLRNIAAAVLEPGEHVVDKQLDSWIGQGVFLAYVGWTRGRSIPESDMRACHILLWEEFSRHLVKWLCEHNDKIIFALFGTRTWMLADETIRKDLAAKFSHPAAHPKDMRTAFKKINELMQNVYGESIRWNTISQNRD